MKNVLSFMVGALCVVGLFSSCVAPVQKMAHTPSGKPEVTITTSDVGRIKSMIIGDLVNYGYTVETDTEYSLLMARRLNGNEEFATALFLGNSYSTNSRTASYTFVKDGSNVRVICSLQVRAQMPLGQIKTAPLDDNGTIFNTFQQQLLDVKKKIEARGTEPASQVAPVSAAPAST